MARERLPDTRPSITHRAEVGGKALYITVSTYEDGRLGELFVSIGKEGSAIRALLDAWATSVSVALQHGIHLSPFMDKFKYISFEPGGITDNKEIPMVKSVLDYIARWLLIKFPDGKFAGYDSGQQTSK